MKLFHIMTIKSDIVKIKVGNKERYTENDTKQEIERLNNDSVKTIKSKCCRKFT